MNRGLTGYFSHAVAIANPRKTLVRRWVVGAAPKPYSIMAIELTAEASLAHVAKRDAQGLGALYDRFAPVLLGLATRILPSRSLAEEVVEDTFLRLWAEAEVLSREGASVAAWLVMTARQAALSRLRADRTVPSHADAKRDSRPRARKASPARVEGSKSARALGPVTLRLAWLPRPEDIALVNKRLELLERISVQLPKTQRDPLELAIFSGLTEEQIAAQLGEPLGSVSTGLRAAITFLRHRQRAVLGTWTADI